MKNWRTWLHKLAGTFIAAFGLAFVGTEAFAKVKQEDVNWKQLLDTSFLAGAGAAAAYLAKSPLPDSEDPPKDKTDETKT